MPFPCFNQEETCSGGNEMKQSHPAWSIAIGIVPGMAIAVGLVWAVLTVLLPEPIPQTALSKARAVTAAAEAAHREQRTRYWIDQIQAGDATFAEASCELDRHGEWDDANDRCLSHDTPFLDPAPS